MSEKLVSRRDLLKGTVAATAAMATGCAWMGKVGKARSMLIADSHCHVSSTWYEPVETLLFQMDQNDVQHALLIQYMGQVDNDYQARCLERFPGRFASIVMVDTTQPDAPDTLAKLAERGAAGVRLSAGTRSPGEDPLAIWRKAEELGLATSCAGGADQFASDEFAALVEAVPDLPIIIEHLGGVKHRNNPDPLYPLAQKVFALARYPNTYIKIPGLGEFCVRNMPVTDFPFAKPIPPFLEMVYEAFGPARMMWGSDYPPVSGREGYRNSLLLTMAQFEDKPETAVEQIFGGTVLALFPTLQRSGDDLDATRFKP